MPCQQSVKAHEEPDEEPAYFPTQLGHYVFNFSPSYTILFLGQFTNKRINISWPNQLLLIKKFVMQWF